MSEKAGGAGTEEASVRLLIDGLWTAGDFSRLFEVLREANALVSAVLLDRLAVRRRKEDASYLRRVMRPDDPKVIIEAVQFGSPGTILARIPGAAKEVWDLLKDLLWGHKAARQGAEVGLALKREEYAQARLRTEAMALELEKLREEIKKARLESAGAGLDLSRREEELAAALIGSRLETTLSLLEAVRGFHERTGIPYSLIERYLSPRLDGLSQNIGYLAGAGLLEGMEIQGEPGRGTGVRVE